MSDLNTVKLNGTCPHDGSKLDIECEREESGLELKLYCTKCEYTASCVLPWIEFQEDVPND